jgi:large subunit ribosomal protein L21
MSSREVAAKRNGADDLSTQPYVAGASVTAVIEQQTLAPKVFIFKKRRRKNSRRLRGFRAAVTSLRIRSISVP